MIIRNFNIFWHALFKYVYEYFNHTYTDGLILKQTKKPILGPMNFSEYTFNYKNKKYKVILDLDVTSFVKFEEYITRSNLPRIPNRGLMSEHVDIDKFNCFMGPCCDFYKYFRGVLLPYSVDFFMNPSIDFEKIKIDVYDTNCNIVSFKRMERIDFNWICDCIN